MVVNWAAGKSGAEITAEKIERQLIVSTDRVKVLLDRVMPLL
jgi:hypothetical protein